MRRLKLSDSKKQRGKKLSPYEGPWANTDELRTLETGDWRYQLPVVKANKCCKCGTCYLFCSVGCIEDKGSHFAADLKYCKGCAVCAQVCPAKAIAMMREE